MSKEVEHIWEKLPDESPLAFKWFCVYRDMGPERSQMKVIKKMGKVRGYRNQLDEWSVDHRWVERVSAYDKHMDSLALKEREKEIKAMSKRHAQQAKSMQSKIIQRLKTIKPADLSPLQLAKWLEIATKIERLALGESTENIKNDGAVEVRIGKEFEGI